MEGVGSVSFLKSQLGGKQEIKFVDLPNKMSDFF